jgi:hypothetical protein
MANPSEWGPLLWKIIHTLSTKLGNQTNKILQTDELNYYNNFTKNVGTVLPCKVCRKHYYDYALKYKKNIEYYELRDYSINYYMNLHNEINSEKNKPLFTNKDFLLYNKIKINEFNSFIKELNTLLQNYVLHQYISADVVRNFNVCLQKLRSVLNY